MSKSKQIKVKYINVYPVVEAVFNNSSQDIIKRLYQIHIDQAKECNSPNFYYKGDTHILVKALPLNPLHDSLTSTMKSHLKHVNTVNLKRSKLIYLLTSFCQSNLLSDLYFVFPKEAHIYLETVREPVYILEHVDNINREYDEEILSIIQEQLLHNLLL